MRRAACAARRLSIASLCAAAGLAVVLNGGCAALKPVPPPPAPLKATAKAVPVESLSASGVVVLKKGFALAGRAVILARRPGSFRIDVAGPFGQRAALLVSDGETFSIYSGAEEKTFRWDDPDLPYPFKAEDFVALLTGAVGQDPGAGAEIAKDAAGNVTMLSRVVPGAPPAKVYLGDYRDVGGASIPFNIRIEQGVKALEIRYAAVEINAELQPDAFSVEKGPPEPGAEPGVPRDSYPQ
ncbi:MAG: hypothetical protein HY894_07805 [Deltaproteobacteria bacterium]|nr:hypothetical protein [Deltaproteobacteria bacterium]